MTTTVPESPVAGTPGAVGTAPGLTSTRGRPRSRRLRGWIGFFLIVGVVAAILAVVFWPQGGAVEVDEHMVTLRDFTVVLHEKGELKAANSIDVKCEVEGRSTIIWLIDEGSEVAEDDLLVKLASEQIDDRVRSEEIKEANAKAAAEAAAKEYDITLDQQASNIRKAELALQNAEIELEKYEQGDWQEQKTDADLAVKRTQEDHGQLVDELSDARVLYELYLFDLEDRFIEQLDQSALTAELRSVFTRHGVQLSEAATLAAHEEHDHWWVITDTAKRYCARVEDKTLKVFYARNFITARELRKKKFAVLEAEIALEKALLRKRVLYDYTRKKDSQQKQSDVDEAKKELDRTKKSAEAKNAQKLADKQAKAAEYEFIKQQLEKFRRQQAKTEIRAPAAGLVVYDTGRHRWDRRQIAEGAEVYERQTIINLPDTELMQVQIRVHEGKANKVELGQAARVEMEGMPGVVLEGKVTKIAPLADSQNMWLNPELKEYQTEITLNSNGFDLKPGVTARVEIIVEEVKDVLAVPVQAAVTKQGHRFVFRGSGASPEPVEVELGRSNDEFVEVQKGLAEGDTVRLAVSEDDLQRIPEQEPKATNGNGLARHEKTPRKAPPAKRGSGRRGRSGRSG
ncbi:MAG: HlyD family efflux transporter periplasmic adaptor subunit [bacterium]|nr:HlyD family efflux transporter periplasmic adaptor subunit [bacterium]